MRGRTGTRTGVTPADGFRGDPVPVAQCHGGIAVRLPGRLSERLENRPNVIPVEHLHVPDPVIDDIQDHHAGGDKWCGVSQRRTPLRHRSHARVEARAEVVAAAHERLDHQARDLIGERVLAVGTQARALPPPRMRQEVDEWSGARVNHAAAAALRRRDRPAQRGPGSPRSLPATHGGEQPAQPASRRSRPPRQQRERPRRRRRRWRRARSGWDHVPRAGSPDVAALVLVHQIAGDVHADHGYLLPGRRPWYGLGSALAEGVEQPRRPRRGREADREVRTLERCGSRSKPGHAELANARQMDDPVGGEAAAAERRARPGRCRRGRRTPRHPTAACRRARRRRASGRRALQELRRSTLARPGRRRCRRRVRPRPEGAAAAPGVELIGHRAATRRAPGRRRAAPPRRGASARRGCRCRA